MVSLIDIGDMKAKVPLRGQDIEVNGITAEHLVVLFHAYPELRKVFTGQVDGDVISSLINQAPLAVAHIVALATGYEPEDGSKFEKACAAARKLAVGEQFAILHKCAEITFPQGAKSFLDGVGAAVGLPPGALGWDQVTKSPAPSSVASAPEDKNAIAGAQPQGS